MNMLRHERYLTALCVVALSLGAAAVNAAEVAIYEFIGDSPASTDAHASTTASDWTQTVGAITDGRVRATGAVVDNTLESSINNNEYGSFTFDTNGKTLDLTQLTVDYGAENAYLFVLSLFASTDGGATGFGSTEGIYRIANLADIAGLPSPPVIENRTNVLDLTGVSSLQAFNGVVEFRFYMHDESGASARVHFLDNIRLMAWESTINDRAWNVDANCAWTTASNWGPVGVPAAGDNVVLGGAITANRTVTLDSNVTLNRLAFSGDSGSYLVTPATNQSITLTGEAELRTTGSRNHVINAQIAGSNGLMKTGRGTLTLTNSNNSYTGLTDVQMGALAVTNAGALPGNVQVSAGASLQLAGDGAGNGYSGVFSNTVTGRGSIVLASTLTSETVVLNAPRTFEGDIQVNGGTLNVTHGGALGASGVNDDRTAIQGGGSTGKLALSGDVAIESELLTLDSRSTNAPQLTSAGQNAWNGNIDIRGGAGQANIESTSGTLTLGGILAAPDGTGSAARTFVFSGAGNTTVTGIITDDGINDANNSTRTASVSRNVNVLKRGSGVLTISTQSSEVADYHRGTTVVEEGTLRVTAGAGDVGELSSRQVLVRAGATLDLTSFSTYNLQAQSSLGVVQEFGGGGTINANALGYYDDASLSPGDGVGTLTINGNLNMSTYNNSPLGALKYELSNTTTVGGGVNDLIVVNGNLAANNDGGVFKVDVTPVAGALASGSYRLINYSGAYTAGADFIAGLTDPSGAPIENTRQTLSVDTNTAGEVNLIVSGSAKNLVWTGPGNWETAGAANWNSGADQYYNLDTVVFDDQATSKNVNIAANVAPGSVTVNGSSTYTFTGAGIVGNGNVNVNGGTVILNNAGNQFTGTVAIANGATLQVGNGASDQNRLPDGGNSYVINGKLVINESGGSEEILGTISGNGEVRVDSSTLVLGGDNSFTGAISAAPGAVIRIANTATGTPLGSAATGVTIGQGATLEAIGQSGTVAKPVTLNGGTLRAAGGTASQLTWSGNVTVGAGGGNAAEIRLDSGTDTASTNGLTIAGNIIGSSGEDVQFNVGANSTVDVSGNIEHGSGGLRKIGDGRVKLHGVNAYSGDTVIAGGVVSLHGTASLGNSSKIEVHSLASLDARERTGGYTVSNSQTLDTQGVVLGNTIAASGSTIKIGGDGGVQHPQREVTLTPPLNTESNLTDILVRSGASANTPQGAGSNLAMGRVNATDLFRTLMSFNLSSTGIADPSYIDEVNLSMTLTGPSGAQVSLPVPPTLELHELATPYDATTVTFNNHPAFETLLASITGPNFGAGNYTAGTVLNWNQQSAGPFIDAVKDALGGNLFVGAKVDNVSESVTSRSFYFLSAAESGAASPKLTIKYTDASVFTPFGIGVGTFDGDLSLSAGSRLELDIFDTSEFDRLDITGALTAGGTLAINLLGTPQAGDSFDLLDFASVAGGSFALELPTLAGGLAWDSTSLLVDGVLSVVAGGGLPGDFDQNGIVDGNDFLVWQRGGSPNGASPGDLAVWKSNFGATAVGAATATVPEPSALALLAIGLCAIGAKRVRNVSRRG